MPIDAYSLCPCGTGKKIKFCCPDLLGDLQKVDRMLEGEQHLACQQHIEQLQEKHPERACLFSLRAMLLRRAGHAEEARANAEAFIEKHPENPVAQAEMAMAVASQGKGREALVPLQRALAVSEGQISQRVFEAMGSVAEALLSEGHWFAPRALLQTQMAISPQDQRPLSMLMEMNGTAGVPMLLKDDYPLTTCPDDAPWKERFDQAMAPVQAIQWQQAVDALTQLSQEVTDSPEIWRNLAILRGWVADTEGCIEAFRKLAALEASVEDAAELEALAMLLCDDPLGDMIEILNLQWTLADVDQLQATLSLEPRASQIPFDPANFASADEVPPKAAYLLLDKPIAESAEDLSLDSVSRVVGQAMVYGRQTDREARLEVIGLMESDVDEAKKIISEVAGECLASPDAEQELMARVSATQEILQHKWRPPAGTTEEQFVTLAFEHKRRAMLKQWPDLKLDVLDGKSPREAADDESYHKRILAAILLVDAWGERSPAQFDFNLLREQLGLPTLGPIECDAAAIGRLPLGRLDRVQIDKLADDALEMAFRRAAAFGAIPAARKFGRELVERPGLKGKEDTVRAFGILSRMEEDPDKALQYIIRGREAGQALGQSCAQWDLQELTMRAMRGEPQEAQRLIEHIQAQHMQEPGVADALMQFLVQVGAIRPDGTPAGPPPMGAGTTAAGPGLGLPTEPPSDDDSGKLWTPDDDGAGGGEAGGKLWTPD